ncbi:Uncharacterised protein [Escherichia coli]|uniref:Uncharacterized protein n=1 Tax=Escherichia coli TaxID=562 RepID=A0A377DJB1_ECOLX|nr:Uncharacterised protein [Escherichia coli]
MNLALPDLMVAQTQHPHVFIQFFPPDAGKAVNRWCHCLRVCLMAKI